jgi:hypothetical protein
MNKMTPIQSSEIKTWEERFKKDVYPFVKFMKSPMVNGENDVELNQNNSQEDDNGNDDVTMKIYSGESGIDATWFGKILLQDDNFIYWEFSLNREPFIKSNITLNNNTVDLFKRLYDYYVTWSSYWLSALAEKSNISEAKGVNRNSKFIIDSYSNRMKKLAGL